MYSNISMILKFQLRQQHENKSRSKLSSYYHFTYNFCNWGIFNIVLHTIYYSTETCIFCYSEVVWNLFCYVNGLFRTFVFGFAIRTYGKNTKACVAVVFSLNFILLSVFITFLLITLNNKLLSSKLYLMLLNSFSYNISL